MRIPAATLLFLIAATPLPSMQQERSQRGGIMPGVLAVTNVNVIPMLSDTVMRGASTARRSTSFPASPTCTRTCSRTTPRCRTRTLKIDGVGVSGRWFERAELGRMIERAANAINGKAQD